MNRFIFLLILLFAFPVNAGWYYSGGEVGCTIPGSPDIYYETNDTSATLTLDAAEGQRFNEAVGGNLAKVCVYLDDTGVDGTLQMRIDDDTDMSSEYIENLGEIGPVSADDWYCLESVTNPTLNSSTTYYIGLMRTANDVKWFVDTLQSPGYASGLGISPGTGWVMSGTNSGIDYNFRVYFCD